MIIVPSESPRTRVPLICLSHLRWDFVYQRPQHLLSRAALSLTVLYVEEPEFHDVQQATIRVEIPASNINVLVPQLPHSLSLASRNVRADVIEKLLIDYFKRKNIKRYDLWYYTPSAISFTQHLTPEVVIYDCMDELSAFLGAPAELCEDETELFKRANLVFTGGLSLYEAKLRKHSHVQCFPSAIDAAHFEHAKSKLCKEADDQILIPKPRVGFYGVIDERFDIHLLSELSQLMPQCHFMIIGPVVKISPQSLPAFSNIHYLGQKSYNELPNYLTGWDVAIMPFARNASTRYISPTKTPEFLAAGRPVVSTSIRDVVRTYGDAGIVSIADSAEEFSKKIEFEFARREDKAWKDKVESVLSTCSWDLTWKKMDQIIESSRPRLVNRQVPALNTNVTSTRRPPELSFEPTA